MKQLNPVEIKRIEDFIKSLDERELLFINHMVIERVKLLRQERSSRQMQQFHPGQRVQFQGPDGALHSARIEKLNKKTAGIITDDGARWKVPPVLLRPLDG